MGKQKYQEKIAHLIANSPVISYKSIEKIVTHKKRVKQYTKQLIRNLIKKNKLKPLIKGYYTASEETSLSVFCFQPAYLGLQDALSQHNLWEQETTSVIITARKIKPGLRTVLGKNILTHRIEPRYYFGIEYFPQGNYVLPYSDLEKTLIDFVHFKQKIGPEVIREFKKKINLRKLKKYLKKYPSQTKKRVWGVLG